jgi:prolyl oligopeptidase
VSGASRPRIVIGLLVVATLVGCASDEQAKKPARDDVALKAAPSSGAEDELARAEEARMFVEERSARWWDMLMERYPSWATSVGDHRFDDRWMATGPDARAAWRRSLEAFRESLADGAPEIRDGDLSRAERTTLELLRFEVDRAIAREALEMATFDVDQMSGPQANLPYFVNHEHPMKTRADVEHLTARYRGFNDHMAGHIADLRAGLERGRTAPRVVVDRVIKQLEALQRHAKSPRKGPFGKVVDRLPEDLSKEDKKLFADELIAGARESVHPSFGTYLTFLKSEYRDRARAEPGLSAMARGDEIYAALAQQHTTTALTPDEIHAIGERELKRIEGELGELGKKLGHEGDPWQLFDVLRKRKEHYAPSRDALLETFREALKLADAKLPETFGRLPKLGYDVEPMDAEREKDAPAAYYQPGSVTDGRKGVFVANLHRFAERPTFNSEVLAYHEAVPGHHLQIAVAQEVEGLPRFRTEGSYTSYVEGWALYSERLSDEMGLYTSLESRVGYLGFAAWRASRLVVDTGLHAKGWSRDKAVAFLASHTTLGPIDVDNEIDRYIAMPGQALAYMVGMLRILELRERAKGALGSSWDVRAFHDAVLGAGALPLDVLDRHVERELGIDPGKG